MNKIYKIYNCLSQPFSQIFIYLKPSVIYSTFKWYVSDCSHTAQMNGMDVKGNCFMEWNKDNSIEWVCERTYDYKCKKEFECVSFGELDEVEKKV